MNFLHERGFFVILEVTVAMGWVQYLMPDRVWNATVKVVLAVQQA
jgi:hypothetical protein